MIAVDTNVLVRLLVGDHDAQTKAAEDLFAAETIFVSTTVVLEAEWVLRSRYRWPAARVNSVLQRFSALENVRFERAGGLAWALERHATGADFADMLHIDASRGSDAFVTFDKAAAAGAGPDTPTPVRLLA